MRDSILGRSAESGGKPGEETGHLKFVTVGIICTANVDDKRDVMGLRENPKQ